MARTPITPPDPLRSPSYPLNRWARQVRDAIIRLRDQREPTQKRSFGGGKSQRLQFEIYSNSSAIFGQSGTLAGVVQNTVVNAGLGNTTATYYLEAEVEIDSTNGTVEGRSVQWTNTESTATSTNFYSTIGQITVTNGVPNTATIVQGNFGPILAEAYGAQTDIWKLAIY